MKGLGATSATAGEPTDRSETACWIARSLSTQPAEGNVPPDVRLPPGLTTEAGPEPQYDFIRGIGVDALHDVVAALVSQEAEAR